MTGLDTLQAEGLPLLPCDPSAQLETLAWTRPDVAMPDADMTVLVWYRHSQGDQDWCSAWWDGQAWRDCASGDVIGAAVLYWAEVAGPVA